MFILPYPTIESESVIKFGFIADAFLDDHERLLNEHLQTDQTSPGRLNSSEQQRWPQLPKTRQVHSLRNLLSPWILGTNRLKCTMYQRCPKTIPPLWAHQGHETHPASQTARFASHLVVSLYNFEIVKMVSSSLGNVINTIKTINTISTINAQECPGIWSLRHCRHCRTSSMSSESRTAVTSEEVAMPWSPIFPFCTDTPLLSTD